MSDIALKVTGVGKSYRRYKREWHRFLAWAGVTGLNAEENWVLRQISFSVAKGEAVGIIGQNGAGKSTLLKLITGTTRATEGQIEVAGRVSALLELGIGFSPELTGRQNAIHSAGLMGFSRAEIERVMPEVEEFAEIGPYFDQPLRTYSSGMTVRVAFAIATAFRPEILIVDEALSVGDARFQIKCFEKIRQFRALGTTLLFVSHDLGAILSLCDRAILLDKGNFIKEGSPQDVYDLYHAVIVEGGKPSTAAQEKIAPDRTQLVYGTREAELEDIFFVDEVGDRVEIVSVGARVTLVMSVRTNKPVVQLNAAYVISDRLGNYVFGMNTCDWQMQVENVAAGERIEFRFTFSANLGPGFYSIATAILPSALLTEGNYEWRGPALLFQVVNTSKEKFIGCSWLEQEISVGRN